MDRPSTALPTPYPIDETYRLHVLASLGLLDSAPEAQFDALVQLTRQVFDCPIALVSLVDDQRQWFKARCGLDATETSRDLAFCAHAIQAKGVMIVPDATQDVRFRDNALVTGAPHIRFYAGIPIHGRLGNSGPPMPLGTLCVIDTRSRDFTTEQSALLVSLGALAEALILGRTHIGNAVSFAEDRNSTAVRLDRKNRQLAQAERMAGVGSWRMSLPEERLEWSDQVFAIHDLPVGRLPTLEGALDFFAEHSREKLTSAIHAAIDCGTTFDVELDFVSAAGIERRVRALGEREMVDGKAVALIGVFQDITRQFRMEQSLRQSANRDSLTAIANRAGFDAALDEAIAVATARDLPLALLLIDLDGFKQVNDLHGHIAGDELLQGVAHRLEMPYLKHCFAARLGGDEFALIVSRPADCEDLEGLADRLLADLRRPFDVGSGHVSVAGTIGICRFDPNTSRRELVHRADLALYEAKRAGKGIARIWREPARPGGGTDRRGQDRRR